MESTIGDIERFRNELKARKVSSDYQNEYHTITTYDYYTRLNTDNLTLHYPSTNRSVQKKRKSN